MKNSQKSQRAQSSGEERIQRFAEIETLILGREVHVRKARVPTIEPRPENPADPSPLGP